MKFEDLWKRLSTDSLDLLLRKEFVRGTILKRAEKNLYHNFVVKNEENRPIAVQEGRTKLLQNLFHTLHKALSDGRISPKVRKAIIGNFIGSLLLGEEDRTSGFRAAHGFYPPAFLTISPTKRCNLMCTGCYAASSAQNAETLSYDVFNRIIREKKELWGSHFTVISGGEPLLYRDGDKTIFDILENNSDNYFMMYTNSTLITKETAARIADLGNLTPAISVEGFEDETDARRGKGTFKRILQAMDNLRNAGVPFGVSITATRNNADIVMSDEFVDYYFNGQGAIYGWIFQYMPIGRSISTDLMITPDQRLALFKREKRLIFETNTFLVDFWNSGPYSVGCISAGRPGGYFYIDWNGNIAPCVFLPYYLSNIYDLYKENKTINDALFSPYFETIRKWQNDYGYTQPAHKVSNYIVPCFLRDHFDVAYGVIKDFKAKGLDENASDAIKDPDYCNKMLDYGRKVHNLTKGIWDEEFMRPERIGAKDKMPVPNGNKCVSHLP